MRFILLLAIAAAIAAFVLFQLYLGSYTALTQESPLARIEMRELGPQRHELDVHFQSGAKATFPMAGDYFMMEAEVITLKNWATVMGEEPRARLTKLRGQYHQILEGAVSECATGAEFAASNLPCRTDYDISDDQYTVEAEQVQTLLAKIGDFLVNRSGAEREPFYSAAGVNLAPGVVWICMTEDALVARPGDFGCGS